MDNLVLHPETAAQLQRFLHDPTHALMLLAPDGSGKRSVAEALARQLLGLTDRKAPTHSAIIYVEAGQRSIPIDAIRDLQHRLSLKTLGTKAIRRAVIIEAAHRMTTEAQNALLKMLEEPSADTVFILTTTSADSVLPTIASRAQRIELKVAPTEAIIDHFKRQNHSLEAINQTLRYSGGRLGLSQAMLGHDETHPLITAMSDARELLSRSLFERLTQVDEWSKQKEELPARLETLQRLCQAGLSQAAEKDDADLLRRWRRYYQAVYDAQASLARTPNPKLLLTNLFLRLS